MRGTIIALIVFLIAIVLIVANFKKILRWLKQLIQWIDISLSNQNCIKYKGDEQNRFSILQHHFFYIFKANLPLLSKFIIIKLMIYI